MKKFLLVLSLFWMLSSTVNHAQANVEEQSPLWYTSDGGLRKGDVNSDGVVNVNDVLQMVNYILALPTAGFVADLADLNNDDTVTVTDVMIVVNIIVSGQQEECGPPRDEDQANPDFPV